MLHHSVHYHKPINLQPFANRIHAESGATAASTECTRLIPRFEDGNIVLKAEKVPLKGYQGIMGPIRCLATLKLKREIL